MQVPYLILLLVSGSQTFPSKSAFNFGDVRLSAVSVCTLLLGQVSLVNLFDLALIFFLEAAFSIHRALVVGICFVRLLLLNFLVVEQSRVFTFLDGMETYLKHKSVMLLMRL